MEITNTSPENTEVVAPIENTTVTTNTEYTEADAIAGLLDSNITQENVTASTQEQNVTETTITSPADEINLNDYDLTFLGVENNEEIKDPNNQAPEVIKTPAPNVEEKPNQMQEILNRLDTFQKQDETQEDNEELAGLKELAKKMQDAGLFPAMSKEQEELLKNAQTIQDNMKEEQEYQQEVEVHNEKVNALEEFSNSLETSIPGYSSALMGKVVANIAATNPEAAQKILNNPMQLLTLWGKVGAKAQPSTKPTNIITNNASQTNVSSDLEQKVMNGSASAAEEAQWLMN